MKKIYIAIVLSFFIPLISFASFNTNLQYGAKGQDVTQLQNFLISKGFLSGQATGNFYSLTKKALIAYQSSVGLPATGFFGSMTRGKINTELSQATVPSTPIQTTGTKTTTSGTVSNTTTSVANPPTPTNTNVAQLANPSTTSTQPYFTINGMESRTTGAIATVGQSYSGMVGFETTLEVMTSKQISFNIQGLPPGLTADNYITQMEWTGNGYASFRGTPTQSGTFPVTVTFTYGNNFSTSKTFYFNVSPAGTVNTSPTQRTTTPSAPYSPPVSEPSYAPIPTTSSTPTPSPVDCVPSTNSSTPVSSTNSIGTITVTSPNGGECASKGSITNITWSSSTNIDKVTIMYVSSSGTTDYVASGIPNTGSYGWNVNVGNTTNTQYKIEIIGYQTGVGSVSDTSDNFFTVN